MCGGGTKNMISHNLFYYLFERTNTDVLNHSCIIGEFPKETYATQVSITIWSTHPQTWNEQIHDPQNKVLSGYDRF